MDQNLSELKRLASIGDIQARRLYNLALLRSGQKLSIPKKPKGYTICADIHYVECNEENCSLCQYIPAGNPRIHGTVIYSWEYEGATCVHKHKNKRAARECARRHAYSMLVKEAYGA